jgi:hypothetical protein
MADHNPNPKAKLAAALVHVKAMGDNGQASWQVV